MLVINLHRIAYKSPQLLKNNITFYNFACYKMTKPSSYATFFYTSSPRFIRPGFIL